MQRERPEERIAELVWLNFMPVPISKLQSNIDHVYCISVYMLFVCGIEMEN